MIQLKTFNLVKKNKNKLKKLLKYESNKFDSLVFPTRRVPIVFTCFCLWIKSRYSSKEVWGCATPPLKKKRHRTTSWTGGGAITELGLTNESAILELLDLKSEEEGQVTHHRHLKSLCHNPTKIIAPSFVSRAKYDVIDIYLAHNDIFINFASEKTRIGFAYLKALP